MDRESRIVPKITRRKLFGFFGAVGFVGLAGANAGQALTADNRVNAINNRINSVVDRRRLEIEDQRPTALRKPSSKMSYKERKDLEEWNNRETEELTAVREAEVASHGIDSDIHKRSRLFSAIHSLIFLTGVGLSVHYAAGDRNKKSLVSEEEFVAPLRKRLNRTIPGLNQVLKEKDAVEAAEKIIRSSQDKLT